MPSEIREERQWRISTAIAIIELIVLIIGSLVYPIYFENRTENVIKVTLGLEGVYEDMSIQELLQSVNEQINSQNEQIIDLETEKKDLLEKNAILSNKVDDYENEEAVAQRNAAIVDNAKNLATAENYEQAVILLRNVTDRTPSMEALLKDYSEKFEGQVVLNAEQLMSAKRYDDALSIVNSALKILPTSDTLSNEYGSIKNRYPTKFSELTLSNQTQYSIPSQRKTDTVGNSYFGNVGVIYAKGNDGYGYATYYLGGNYRYLSLTIAVSDESEERTDSDLNGRIEIYAKTGDKREIIYESPTLTRVLKPIAIEDLKVNDCDFLEICYYNNGEYWNLTEGYHSLRILIADGIVYN